MACAPASAAAFRHSALIVESDRGLRQLLGSAVRRAMREADGVFIAVSPGTGRLLRDELGAAAESGAVEWGQTAAFCQRLGFAYEGFRRLLAAAHLAGRRVHVFVEPDLGHGTQSHGTESHGTGGGATGGDATGGGVTGGGVTGGGGTGTADRTVAYLAYEAIRNETYADYGCDVTCLWDARRHPAALIENVRALHSHQLGPEGVRPSPGYRSPRHYLAGLHHQPLPPPAAVDWQASLPGSDGLPALRKRLRAWADDHGYAAAAAADVTLAVNEIATNGLSHGRPPVEVRGWRHGDTLIVQVDDRGGNPLPAAGGYEPPRQQQDRTRGLWLARQLADVVQTHAGGGTTSVRLHFPYLLTHQRPPYLAGPVG